MCVVFKRRVFLLTMLLFIFLAAEYVLADEAADITARCRFDATANSQNLKRILTDDYKYYWNAYQDGRITVTLPKGYSAQGIQLSFYRQDTWVEVLDASGETIACTLTPYRTQWIPFRKPVDRFEIRRMHPDEPLLISRIHVLTPGKLPNWIQRWEMPEGDMDLMVLSTHPDDEILWFGGLIPYYAGELKKKVVVVYMVGGLDPTRVLELLDGLWVMGVTRYPDIGCLYDTGRLVVSTTLDIWGPNTLSERITETVRRYRPSVLVMQDINGEYGHPHHILTVNAAMDVLKGKTADPEFCPESAALYGVWQPHKVYIHLYKENVIDFDWQQPLDAFGGKTGLEVAKEAYRKHRSQHHGRYRVSEKPPYDSSLFGLYWSDVGNDLENNDMFENLP